MKRLLSLLLLLYPIGWRRRYGAELEALLQDLDPTWTDAFDLVSGATAMRMRSPLAVLTVCAFLGAVSFAALAVLLQRDDVYEARIDVSVRNDELRRADSMGRPIAIERTLAQLRTDERNRVTFDWGSNGPHGHAILGIIARGDTPESAQRLTARAVGYLGEGTLVLQAVSPNTEPMLRTPQIQPSVWRMSIDGAKNGLLLGFVLMLIVPRLRRRGSYA